jgi:hypothetical protein
MRVPDGVDMVFSYGGLTGRKVNGQVRLLMFGSRNIGDPIYELADTGTYNPNPAQAPRMSLIRNWGSVYGDKRKTWSPNGTERNIDLSRYMGSLHFNAETDLLYWTYFDSYNTTAEEDWCLGATRLSDAGAASFGPWRPAGEGKKGPWRCIRLAQHPDSGELLCGSGVMSGNHSSPWGPDLWAGPFPRSTTPGGWGRTRCAAAEVRHVLPDVQQHQPRRDIHRAAAGSTPQGVSVRTDPRRLYLCTDRPGKEWRRGIVVRARRPGGNVWINLPDCHGVIFTGRLATEHVWYRNAGQGNDRCTHGMESPVGVTGPVSTNAYPVMFIYDPADLDAVRAGKRIDYTIDPVHSVNMEARFGVATAAIKETGSAKMLAGAYFDPQTRKLYVAAPQSDLSVPGLLNPLVHVFRVA